MSSKITVQCTEWFIILDSFSGSSTNERERKSPAFISQPNGKTQSGNLFHNSWLSVSERYVGNNSVQLHFTKLLILLSEMSVHHIHGLFIFFVSGGRTPPKILTTQDRKHQTCYPPENSASPDKKLSLKSILDYDK